SSSSPRGRRWTAPTNHTRCATCPSQSILPGSTPRFKKSRRHYQQHFRLLPRSVIHRKQSITSSRLLNRRRSFHLFRLLRRQHFRSKKKPTCLVTLHSLTEMSIRLAHRLPNQRSRVPIIAAA